MSFDLKIKNGDIVIDPNGSLSTVFGNSKIRQDIIKILLTRNGENRFHPRYGSDLGALKIGEVSDEKMMELDLQRSVEDAIKYLMSLQSYQSKKQVLSSGEIISAIRGISSDRDSEDPRLYNIYISVLTQKLDIVEEVITIRIV